MCRHSEAMGGGTLDCMGRTQSVVAANNYSPQQPQPRIKRSLSLSRFYCNALESALSEVFVFDHVLKHKIEANGAIQICIVSPIALSPRFGIIAR
jgi:hypothetical protein